LGDGAGWRWLMVPGGCRGGWRGRRAVVWARV